MIDKRHQREHCSGRFLHLGLARGSLVRTTNLFAAASSLPTQMCTLECLDHASEDRVDNQLTVSDSEPGAAGLSSGPEKVTSESGVNLLLHAVTKGSPTSDCTLTKGWQW